MVRLSCTESRCSLLDQERPVLSSPHHLRVQYQQQLVRTTVTILVPHAARHSEVNLFRGCCAPSAEVHDTTPRPQLLAALQGSVAGLLECTPHTGVGVPRASPRHVSDSRHAAALDAPMSAPKGTAQSGRGDRINTRSSVSPVIPHCDRLPLSWSCPHIFICPGCSTPNPVANIPFSTCRRSDGAMCTRLENDPPESWP